MIKKILSYFALVVFAATLYLAGVAVAVSVYTHDQKAWIPRTLAAQYYVKGPYSPTPSPSWSYGMITYPDVYSPGPDYPTDTPTPHPTMGIPPGPTPAPKPTCHEKKCN